MKITGKFWLKSGQSLTETVQLDPDADEVDLKKFVDGINDIRQAVCNTFKNSMVHGVIKFGDLVIRGDDCSAVSFKEVSR